MDKVKIFQKLPGFLKTILASLRGYQLKLLRSTQRQKFLKEIKAKDTWSKAQIHEFQRAKLREILDHAVKHVPYYRSLWKELKKNHPEKNHLDINNWPILEKDSIRNDPDAFIADGINKKKLTHISTSGTSGKPMDFFFDRYSLSYWYAMFEYRIRNWNGVTEEDRWANFGAQLIYDINQDKPPFWLWNSGMNQLYLSAYHVSPKNTGYYIDALKKYRVKYLLGFVTAIYNLANEGLKLKLDLPQFKIIITNAEPLYEHQKETIEKAFKCKVLQAYGSCEYVFASNENLEGYNYISPEVGYGEVLNEQGIISPNGRGELLTTGFLNKAMPLIRYRLGDTVIINTGVAGSMNFDLIEEIVGRTDDLVILRDGQFVGRLDPVFKYGIRIKEAQIIQEDYEVFTLRIVPDEGFSNTDTDSMEARLRDRVGKDVTIKFELVDHIPRGPNGKFKAIISKIPHKA